MGVETALAVGGTLASTLLQNQANRKQAQRQEELNKKSAEYKLAQAADTRQQQDKFLDTQIPEARANRQAEVDQAVRSGIDQTVSDIKGFEIPETTTGTGADYAQVRSAGKARTDDRLKRAMEQMAVLGGVARGNERDARDYAKSAYAVGAANRAGANVGAMYDDAMSKTQPDPYLSLASGLAKGGAYYFATKPKTPTTTPTAGLLYD